MIGFNSVYYYYYPCRGRRGGVRELAMMAMRSLPQPFVEPGAGDGTGSTEVGWEFASAGAKRADPPHWRRPAVPAPFGGVRVPRDALAVASAAHGRLAELF